jgi:hypothetical protein
MDPVQILVKPHVIANNMEMIQKLIGMVKVSDGHHFSSRYGPSLGKGRSRRREQPAVLLRLLSATPLTMRWILYLGVSPYLGVFENQPPRFHLRIYSLSL